MRNSLRGFIPWIAFAVVSGFADLKTAAIVAVVLSLLLVIRSARAGHGLDEQVIEISATVFFVVLTLVAFASPNSPIKGYTGALSSAWLAVTAWGSMAIHKPFTLGIARKSVPAEFWDNPLFYRANVIITAVWAASFTVTAVLSGIIDIAMTNPDTLSTIVQIAGFVIPAIFTIRYQQTHHAQSVDQPTVRLR